MKELLSDSKMACNGRLIASDILQEFRNEIDDLFQSCIENCINYAAKLSAAEIEIVSTDDIDEIDEIILAIEESELDDVTSTFEDLKTFLVDRIEDDGDDIVIEQEIHIEIPS